VSVRSLPYHVMMKMIFDSTKRMPLRVRDNVNLVFPSVCACCEVVRVIWQSLEDIRHTIYRNLLLTRTTITNPNVLRKHFQKVWL